MPGSIDYSGKVSAYGRELWVPKHTMDTLQSYIEDGIPPGDFVRSVLACGDLTEILGRADMENFFNFQAVVCWIYNYCPMPARCSHRAIDEWIDTHSQKREAARKEKERAGNGG